MKNLSLVFLMTTILTCVFFWTQPERRKQIGDNMKSNLRKTDDAQETTEWESLRKIKDHILNVEQWDGDFSPKKRQRKQAVDDQNRIFGSGNRKVKSNKVISHVKNLKGGEGRNTKTTRAVDKIKTMMDGRKREKIKEDRNVKSSITIRNMKTWKDEKGRNIHTSRVANSKKKSKDDRDKKKIKEDRHAKGNMSTNNNKTSEDALQKEMNDAVKYIHNSVPVIKEKEFKKHKFEFRNAVEKIKQYNIPFGGDGHTDHQFRYHHTIQKRDVDGQNEIKENTCPLGESDVEQNCESLFLCCHNENKTNPNCYCDELCPLFDDCCHDSNTTSLAISETYRLLKSRIHCGKVWRTLTPDTYQVVACPRTYTNNNISKQCEISFSAVAAEPLLIIPVTDPLQVTYKNIFCAICNGVYNVRLWAMRFSIKQMQYDLNVSNIDDYTWKEFPSLQHFVMVFPPDDLLLRFCNGYAVKSTQEENQVTGGRANKCRLFQQLFDVLDVYRKKACLTAAWEYEYCKPDHVINTNCSNCEPYKFTDDTTRWRPYGMDVMFTFKMENDDCDNSHKISAVGDENSLYICPTSTLVNPYYILECYFLIEGNLSQSTFDFLGTALVSYVNALADSETSLEYYTRSVYESTECDIQRIKIKVNYLTQTDQSQWNQLKRWYEGLHWTYTEIHDRGKVVVSRLSSTLPQNCTKCDLSSSKIETSTMFIKENSATFQYLPRTQRFCQNVNFTLEINYPEASVSDQLNELMVSESDCAVVMDVRNSQDIFDDVLTVVSNILMGTGCVTLVCSLVSTFVLKADMSIPGLITRHMMITTLLFQFLFIVGIGATDNYVVCFSFGVALHYCTLCAFAWMSICAGYLANTLMKIRKLPGSMHDRDRKFRLILICFGYILPTFIVIPSVIIDTCQCTPFTIDYGRGICFPNPRAYPEGLFVFIGPISVHILFNIVFLSVSIKELSRTRTNEAVLSISRSYTPIYLKLCVYSGIGWVFGIAALVFPFDVIKLMFIVSCSSQGLFLSVITLCKIRVLRRLRSHLSTSNKVN